MLEILGIKVPVTKQVFYTKNSPIVMEYLNAMKRGQKDAQKYFKGLVI